MRVLVVTDNECIFKMAIPIIGNKIGTKHKLTCCFSYNNECLKEKCSSFQFSMYPINVKKEVQKIKDDFDMVLSIHCKQIFPKELVEEMLCINIHPGLNPYNRGWFPHVFSIINGLPCGATLHVMDKKIDNGPIIAQKEVEISRCDTSTDVYKKIIKAEINLLEENLLDILNGSFSVFNVSDSGNINSKKEYQKLLKIDLKEKMTAGDFINRVRALTHDNYNNCYFEDDDGKKIYIKLNLYKES